MAVKIEELDPTKGKDHLKRCEAYLARARQVDKYWRKISKRARRYRDGDMWDPRKAAVLEARNQPVITDNIVEPKIRSMVAAILANAIEWQTYPVGAADDEKSKIGAAFLKHIFRENDGEEIYSSFVESVLTDGISIIQVGWRCFNDDPTREGVQIGLIPAHSFWFDPTAKRHDKRDAKFAIVAQEVDLAAAIKKWPKSTQALRQAVDTSTTLTGGAEAGSDYEIEGATADYPRMRVWDLTRSGWSTSDTEPTVDPIPRVKVFELWERTLQTKLVVNFQGNFTQVLDLDSPEAGAIILDPRVISIEEAQVPVVMITHWVDGHVLSVEKSPYRHAELPFSVCCWDLDRHRCPIPFAKSMLDAADENNQRRSRALSLVLAPQYTIDPALLDELQIDAEELSEWIHTPGKLIPALPGQIQPLPTVDSVAVQLQFRQMSRDDAQESSGVNAEMAGYENPSARSAKAKQMMLSQGQSMHRSIENRIRRAFCFAGELAFLTGLQYHDGPYMVRLEDDATKTSWVEVNASLVDENGQVQRVNNITDLRWQISVNQRPITETNREFNFESLAGMANQETEPTMRWTMQILALMASNLPNKKELIDTYRGALQKLLDQQAQQAAPQQ